jgi:hypothetical protein
LDLTNQTPLITKLRFEILLSRNYFWVWQMTTHYQTQSCKWRKEYFSMQFVLWCRWECACDLLLQLEPWVVCHSSFERLLNHLAFCSNGIIRCVAYNFYVTIQISISTHSLQWRSTSMSCNLQKFLTKGFEPP